MTKLPSMTVQLPVIVDKALGIVKSFIQATVATIHVATVHISTVAWRPWTAFLVNCQAH